MTRCYVCERPATSRVEVQTATETKLRYAACDEHAPTYIPGGDVAVIKITSIR